MQNAYNKHLQLSFEVLATVPESERTAIEQYYIDCHFSDPLCMNVNPTAQLRSDETLKRIADSQRGKQLSEEQKQHLSNVLKGRTFSDEHRQNISEGLKGRVLSKESRQKISDKNKGRKMSKEFCEKRSKLVSGAGNPMYGVHLTGKLNHNYGKEMSEEQKAKLRGRTFSEEHKANISKAMSKPVQAVFPDGAVLVFDSTVKAAESLKCDSSLIQGYISGKYSPDRSKRFAGCSFSYI